MTVVEVFALFGAAVAALVYLGWVLAQPDSPTEEEAAGWLALRGFRWIDGGAEFGIYRMTHEDPEGWWEGEFLFAADSLVGAMEELR